MRALMPCDPGSYSYAGLSYANPHALTSAGGTSYTYDNNGNVTAIGSLDYTWDWRNGLASAERSGGGITSYGYDHTGQRVFKATGTATTSYPNKYYSLHPDHLGGTNVTTDEHGEVTQTLDYYPYGSQRIPTGSFSEQRRFIGEEFDGDTEFSYLNARYYQGSRGQFMSQDPVFVDLGEDERTGTILADPQLPHSYAYSRNNPLILKDEGGELPHVIIGAGGAMAGQYLYDVYNNVQANGFGASAFYRDLSSPETYAVRAAQGVAVALTGGLVGGLGLASAHPQT